MSMWINGEQIRTGFLYASENLKNQKDSPIEEIYSNDSISNLGADRNAIFMVEAREGYYFIDDLFGEIIEKLSKDKSFKIKHKIMASHGYLPTKDNYKTFFIASGKGIKSGVVLENGKLINHGPTIAKVLGIDLKDADGMAEGKILDI